MRTAILIATLLQTLLAAQSVTLTPIAASYSVHQSFSMDTTTGHYFRRPGYDSGPTVTEYADRADFEADVVLRTFTAGSGSHYGTYFAVSSGKLFGRTSNSMTDAARWDTTSGAREASVPSFANMCGTNGTCTFNWGGYSGVNFLHDGTDLFVFGKNVGAGWQLNRLDDDLLVLQTWQHPDDTLGFGFLINGVLFTGPSYSGNSITVQLDTVTGVVTPVFFTLNYGPSPYWGCTVYDPIDDVLYLHDVNASRTSRVDNAAATFNVPAGRLSILSVDTLTTQVYAGETGVAVSMSVQNNGMAAVDLTGSDLLFLDPAMSDLSSEYVVTPSPANPASIAAAATVILDYSVDVGAGATLTTVTLDGGVMGTEVGTGRMVSRTGADVTDDWTVVACGATLCGDCNGDGVVNILDALQGARHSAALITLTGADFISCNVVGTTGSAPPAAVDVLDALTIAQFAAGLPVVLTCC